MKNQISRISATEAARNFSELLDRASQGQQVFVERRKELVAVLGPPSDAPRRISECLRIRLSGPPVAPDPDFARDLEELIRGNPADEPIPWDS